MIHRITTAYEIVLRAPKTPLPKKVLDAQEPLDNVDIIPKPQAIERETGMLAKKVRQAQYPSTKAVFRGSQPLSRYVDN